MRRDPLESPLISTALFGSVLLLGALIKLVRVVVLSTSSSRSAAPDLSELGRIGGFLLVFALGAGCTVAFARRRLLAARGTRVRNFVTGGVVGLWYAGGCYLFFGGDFESKVGLGAVLGGVLLGIWYAVASGLNQAFAEARVPDREE